MTIEIIKKTSWTDVLNAARFTVRKPMADKEPSDNFKRQMVMAEHSPLRELVFTIVLHDIPKYCSTHLVRHNIGIEKFVTSSRPDRNGFKRTRHEQRDDDLVDMMMTVNAQALINISKVRLCNKAEATTRELWRSIINVLASTEPILAKACVPSCIYRGLCPEISTCHAFETEKYKNWREGYVRGE